MNSITRATLLFSTLITALRVRNSSASSCLRTRIKKHEADGRRALRKSCSNLLPAQTAADAVRSRPFGACGTEHSALRRKRAFRRYSYRIRRHGRLRTHNGSFRRPGGLRLRVSVSDSLHTRHTSFKKICRAAHAPRYSRFAYGFGNRQEPNGRHCRSRKTRFIFSARSKSRPILPKISFPHGERISAAIFCPCRTLWKRTVRPRCCCRRDCFSPFAPCNAMLQAKGLMPLQRRFSACRAG